jgi:succinate dehydrogenase / fumarate reductase, flavoprotein subunit
MLSRLSIESTIRCDVLIVGAGGAGLRAAAQVLEKSGDAGIVAVTKVAHCQKSHTSAAQGGLSAVDPQDPHDDLQYYIFDTWKGSDCSADQNVIKKVVEAGWEQVIWLENHGMHFTRDEKGRLAKRTFGGHTVRFGEGPAYRAVYEADRTGKGMVDTAWGECLRGGVRFLNETSVTELIFREDRCVGAILFNFKTGGLIKVLAQATLFCTGGSGQMFKVTTNCRQNTADGLAVVLRAGLHIMDPEAVQFHPTGIVGPGILASETLRSIGGILRNKGMEPFMERYAPKMKELAPRDLVARAIELEIREGRGILNPDHAIEHVWLDLTHLPANVHDEQIPEVSGFFKKFAGIDPKKDLCPVRPSMHYHMGGIPTNEYGQVCPEVGSVMPGLFAVGECASASFQGFNRLGTNSLLELITMAKFAGEKAAEKLGGALEESGPDAGEVSRAEFAGYLEATGREQIGTLRSELQQTMTENVGVFRNEAGLNRAIEKIAELKERSGNVALRSKSLHANQELLQRWELENLLMTARVVAHAARERRESRGGHAREDFPERKNEFNRHTLARIDSEGRVMLGSRPVDISLFEAKGKHYERFGYIERKY